LSVRAQNRVRGGFFEALVESLLRSSGFSRISDDANNRHGKLKGRGAWHQIDAFGEYNYGVPCLFPIRLIAEAKCYSGKAGLPTIRNFLGAFKDIAENYFVEDFANPSEYLLTRRHTDTAAVFSAHGFTLEAQGYAYAQGVFLISYENNPLLEPLIALMDPVLDGINIQQAASHIQEFKAWMADRLEGRAESITYREFTNPGFEAPFLKFANLRNRVRTSSIGTASGIYPIHFLSEQEIPWEIFDQRDSVLCRVRYREGSENCLEIEPTSLPSYRFYVSIPPEIVVRYRDRMTEFKQQFFQYVDIPVRHGETRRILRFELDMEWLRRIRSRRSFQGRTEIQRDSPTIRELQGPQR
jgi:hypothetical protein